MNFINLIISKAPGVSSSVNPPNNWNANLETHNVTNIEVLYIFIKQTVLNAMFVANNWTAPAQSTNNSKKHKSAIIILNIAHTCTPKSETHKQNRIIGLKRNEKSAYLWTKN